MGSQNISVVTSSPAQRAVFPLAMVVTIMNNLEETFITGCKAGNLNMVIKTMKDGVNVNCSQGWGLRRAVRYGHSEVWQVLLKNPMTDLNLVNKFGLSSLHTACRFGVVEAVMHILQHPAVLVNEKTKHGSTPLMVAVKYGKKVVVEIMIKDHRVDLGVIDSGGRSLYEVIGVATEMMNDSLKSEITELIKAESNKRSLRKKKKGVHKVLDPSQLIVKQAREKVDRLVSDMEETQRIEMMRFQENLENNSREFNDKQKEEQENFSLKIEEEKNIFFQNQEIQRNRFLSELERCKYVFVKMQQEASQQFVSNENLNLDNFKETQAKQRQSFQLSNKAEELSMSSLIDTDQSIDNSTLQRNLNIFPDVSDLVGRNSFSLPASERISSTDKEAQGSFPDQCEMTHSLNVPDMEKSSKSCQRKSVPVMGPPLTKEHNIDRPTADQLSKHSLSATTAEWRKTSCPASLTGAREDRHLQLISPSYPYTPPPSPAVGSVLYFMEKGDNSSPCYVIPYIQNINRATSKSFCPIQTRLSPMQSFSSNTSSNPSPVPSLEYIPPNEMFTRIPDTCPNIKALINNHELFNMPQEINTSENFSLESSPKSPSNVYCDTTAFPFPDVAPLYLKENKPNSPNYVNHINSSFLPIKAPDSSPILSTLPKNHQPPNQIGPNLFQIIQENSPPVTKINFVTPKSSLTPRLTRKSAMEVVKEEDDVEDQGITKDDEEIAELTNTGMMRNKSSSFTNLVSTMKSPSPSRSRGTAHPEENKTKHKGEENKRMFFLEMENDFPDEEMIEIKERSQSLPESNIPFQDMNENISKQFSGLSLASSASTASFKSAQTSPVKEFD